MRENSMRENRERPETPAPMAVRDGRRRSMPKSDMHVSGKSDDLVVPTKRANKAGTPVAESVEGRRSTKGKSVQAATYRTQCRTWVSFCLDDVRQVGRFATDRHTQGKSRMR